MKKILIIQTAFIGDVVLATAVVEKLAATLPDLQLDFLVRKGNEGLLVNNPHIHETIVWDKKQRKYAHFMQVLNKVRKAKYDKVINLQRYFSTGFLTVFSSAGETIGFDKNPLSFLFSKKIKHVISNSAPYKHEVERNNELVEHFAGAGASRPKLYPSPADEAITAAFVIGPYVTMSPSSVWFTKQYPVDRWVQLMNAFPRHYNIYMLGGKENIAEAEMIRNSTENKNVVNLAGKFSFLQSASVMGKAAMNYVNDSAPLHFASAVNAPVTAIFCSTLPVYGFTPLSDVSLIAQIDYNLYCRSCGLHGRKACPEKHFKCAYDIPLQKLLNVP